MDAKMHLQWTLSISTTLYLEYLSISNKMFRSLKLRQEHCIAFLYFEFLYLELFPVSNKFSGPLNHFLSLSRRFTNSNFIFRIPK